VLGDVQQVGVGADRAAVEDELIQRSAAEWHDSGDRVPVVGDLDCLTANHAPEHLAYFLAQLPYAYTVIH
jgi:hypothetical protein